MDFKQNVFRLDPFDSQIDFSITRLEVSFGKFIVLSLAGTELVNYIEDMDNVEYKVESDNIDFKATGEDVMIMMNSAFSDKLYQWYLFMNRVQYIILCILFLLLGLLQIQMKVTDWA